MGHTSKTTLLDCSTKDKVLYTNNLFRFEIFKENYLIHLKMNDTKLILDTDICLWIEKNPEDVFHGIP